jgi:hypothetical protein
MSLLGLNGKALSEFKGRSCFAALKRESEALQLTIHLEMDDLIRRSKVAGANVTLQKHRTAASNWKVRWRAKRGITYSHVLWVNMGDELKSLPVAISQHYEKINRRIEELNHLDIMVVHTIRWCAIHMGQKLARNSPVEIE